ncbi:MAG: hypothetical protein P1S46_06175 [bacterium]|nr:hypothetical protein [bacterium]
MTVTHDMARANDLTTKSAIAEHLGISRPQLDKYIVSRGIKGRRIKGYRHPVYSLSEVEGVYRERDVSKSRKDDNNKGDGGDYWKWKAVTEELKAQKMELELAIQRGELTDTARATKTVADLCRTITDAIYAAQDRLATHMDHKLAARVRREFDKAIETVSSSAKKAAETLAKTQR